MSLVYITYHNENVLDFDKEDLHVVDARVEYTSKYRKKVEKEARVMHIIDLGDNKKLLTESPKYKHLTMGCAETPLDPPCKFLRKKAGIVWRRHNDHKCPPKRGLQPIPKPAQLKKPCQQKNEKGDVKSNTTDAKKGKCPSRVNFVVANINIMKNASCKNKPPRYVDTPVGHCHNLLNTGLIPQYICSKNFGKVPCYIKARKKFLKKLNEQCKEEKELLEQPCTERSVDQLKGLRKLPAEERLEILTGLKDNFDKVFKAYNGLSLYTDTHAKKLRKGKLETQMRQLEQDILLMESNPEIYVNEF